MAMARSEPGSALPGGAEQWHPLAAVELVVYLIAHLRAGRLVLWMFRLHGNSRGLAFVEYSDVDACSERSARGPIAIAIDGNNGAADCC